MTYNIKFDDITALQVSTQSTIASWAESISSLNTAMAGFINEPNFQGQTATSIRTYLSEVHGTLMQTLVNLMADYSSSLLLYKDGYYNIDSAHHAVLPGQVFTHLQSDLKTSRDDFKSQLELLDTAKTNISDLVTYPGNSHTRTVLSYNFLLTHLTSLDEAVKQYESHHASQDLTAFKELLSATKTLISEHVGKPRHVGAYQSGDLGQLKSIERFATAYQSVATHLANTTDRVQAAQERDQARFEALAAEDRANQGWIDLALSVLTIAVGVIAIVASGGSATPLVVGAWIAGSGTVAYGLSNATEAGQDIYLGYQGDSVTAAWNPIRDTLFMGDDKSYDQVGGLFSTASAVMIPIGQTQSVAKGLAEFAIGEVGGFVGGQAAYHGTKLLGASEQDAQRANFVGNLLGGYAVSSAATKFSLNEVDVPPVKSIDTSPTYSREQVLKNLENSRLARESSNFSTYLYNENFVRKIMQIDYVKLSEELGDDLMAKGFKIIDIETAEIANADWAKMGYTMPPVAKGTKVYNVEAGNHKYARVFKEGSRSKPKSPFILLYDDIDGLSAEQIAEKYALPQVPDRIVFPKIPADTPLEVSIVGPQKSWGTLGGDAQYTIKDVLLEDGWFTNIKELD